MEGVPDSVSDRPEAAPRVNVADRLAAVASERPNAIALAAADGRGGFATIALGQLDADADTLARGLLAMGIGPGKRIALLVRPGIEFVTLVFALLRTGATMVLVDAGLGRKNIVRCLESTEPDGFVAIPLGHALRVLKRNRFPKAKLNVTVGRRWCWGGETLASLRKLGAQQFPSPTGGGVRGEGTASVGEDLRGTSSGTELDGLKESPDDGHVSPSPSPSLKGRGISGDWPLTAAADPAAIVFTSGSTGPPKGVLYTHQTFATQCAMIQAEYDIRPGDIDLACFPLFGLFNVACGVTTVLPEMDFSRPASCDPKKLIAAANQWKVNQAFASPAVWDRLSRHCEATGDTIPTLKKILSCGAPVPAKVMRRTLKCVHPDARMHTPYGATEALPIATIEAGEILEETAAKTDEGAGVCVGRMFGSGQRAVGSGQPSDGEPTTPVVGAPHQPAFDWRIIRITDDPIPTIDDTEELPAGEIGELIVRGPQVSERYLIGEPQASAPGANDHNAKAKIIDERSVWHRMGDVGYFDDEGRFWYCGRKSQRVVTSERTLFTECIEGQLNTLPHVNRSALVGVGKRSDRIACVITEPGIEFDDALEFLEDGILGTQELNEAIAAEIRRTVASDNRFAPIAAAFIHPNLPTDIRHNSKIRREELAVWAEKQLRKVGEQAVAKAIDNMPVRDAQRFGREHQAQ